MLLSFNFFNGNVQTVARLDGLLLLLTFAGFMAMSFYRDSKARKSVTVQTDNPHEKTDKLWLAIFKVAGGTSLPELAASIAAALKKNTSMALGNVVGSNIFNIALILGLCSQVTPLTSTGITTVDYLVMIAAVFVLYAFGKNCKIERYEGVLLFAGFIAYTWYLISNQIA